MPFRWDPRQHISLALNLLKWMLIAVPVGAIIGTAVTFFLWLLDLAIRTRWNHPWLLWLLPVAGAAIGGIYAAIGKSVEGGNDLIMEQIHEPGGGVPARMAPLVLFATVVTHLFGGSAGREGTAVQMGGSIASAIAKRLHLSRQDTRALLMAGVAGGFGSVFGTPITGAIFAVEVLAVGIVRFQSIIPCLIASIVGDFVCTAWNLHWHGVNFHISHVGYQIAPFENGGHLQMLLLMKVAVAAVAFGLASVIFAQLTHGLKALFNFIVPWPALRPALGGVIVICLAATVGADYLGLGVTADPHHPNQVSIVSSFHSGGTGYFSWWWKTLFTAVTLGSGFKGGEVTPLFFVGAALGNCMGRLLHAPVDLMAGLGFVAVFAGATNTPLACTIMGIELFAAGQAGVLGSGLAVYLAVACFVAQLLSGRTSIYHAQQLDDLEV